ncbi:winged helix-turn-helix transcriptional regulator [Flavobacterium sp. '19STA2R22 D10 B1']|uniref:winged helix-turn-helix transcriptional regulator n=1 Tax=Flavobacterium aerium TaxID=3037261 RepID=UPI00278C71A1|nr:helix-turn-helix domain-containing protein [Flavobacterium sp. '19STA2R22 D10 B1']
MKEINKRSDCPISFSLDFLGDKWTLLIIRDLILAGKSNFGEFLKSEESIATNILTDRLKMLEAQGFVLKYPVKNKMRYGYCLTERGISLIPIILEMAVWGISQEVLGSNPELSIQLKDDKAGVIDFLVQRSKEKLETTSKML